MPITRPMPLAPTWVRWRIVGLLLLFSFMSWFNRASMAAAGDERIMPTYGVSKEAMGAVYSAFLFVYAVFMTPGGWFIDRFGPKTALVRHGLWFRSVRSADGLGRTVRSKSHRAGAAGDCAR